MMSLFAILSEVSLKRIKRFVVLIQSVIREAQPSYR